MGCCYSDDNEPEETTPFSTTYTLYKREFKALRLKESDVRKLYDIFITLDSDETVLKCR